jgi:hypothetical protein
MERKQFFVGATVAHIDAALGLLAPDGYYKGLSIHRRRHLPLPPPNERGVYKYNPNLGYAWQPGTLAMPAPSQLFYDVSMLLESELEPWALGRITAHELPAGVHVVFTDGRGPDSGCEKPPIGAPFEALAKALEELLTGDAKPPAEREREAGEIAQRNWELFRSTKEAHKTFGYERVAEEATRAAKARMGQGAPVYTAEMVRHAYRTVGRPAGYVWERGERRPKKPATPAPHPLGWSKMGQNRR